LARAHRHYIPGHIWHITHRCHKSEFLLKYVKDRHRWLQWLFEAKKRYGLSILNYVVTSNHIHMLVYDNHAQETILKSMQLIAGRFGQEFNQRKSRSGSFWEDRYHATIIDVVAEVKRKLGAMSVGRRVQPSKDGFELKETIDPYNARFETEKCDIDANNTWYWDLNHSFQYYSLLRPRLAV